MLSEMRKVLSLTHEESSWARERHTSTRIPLVTTYNPHTSYIAEMANRTKSLRDVLVSKKQIENKNTNDQTQYHIG